MVMHVKFWGTRGSIPRPQVREAEHERLRAVLTEATSGDIATPDAIEAFIKGGCRGVLPTVYGGNTACVQVTDGDGPSLLIDLGTGCRDYASQMMRRHGPVAPEPYHVLMSHFHWDHIMGFPFFVPAYIPGNVINIYSCHPHVEDAFRRQHGFPSFPVPFDVLAADIRFHVEVSGDLINWSSGSPDLMLLSSLNNGDGTVTEVYRSATPTSVALREFMRVVVETK